MEKQYKVCKGDTKQLMSYSDICHELGFTPESGFVTVTTAGTISFSLGKPEEIKALLRSVNAHGYKPSKALIDSAR